MRFRYVNSVKQAAQFLCRATETIRKLYSVSKRVHGKPYLARSSRACENGIDLTHLHRNLREPSSRAQHRARAPIFIST